MADTGNMTALTAITRLLRSIRSGLQEMNGKHVLVGGPGLVPSAPSGEAFAFCTIWGKPGSHFWTQMAYGPTAESVVYVRMGLLMILEDVEEIDLHVFEVQEQMLEFANVCWPGGFEQELAVQQALHVVKH